MLCIDVCSRCVHAYIRLALSHFGEELVAAIGLQSTQQRTKKRDVLAGWNFGEGQEYARLN